MTFSSLVDRPIPVVFRENLNEYSEGDSINACMSPLHASEQNQSLFVTCLCLLSRSISASSGRTSGWRRVANGDRKKKNIFKYPQMWILERIGDVGVAYAVKLLPQKYVDLSSSPRTMQSYPAWPCTCSPSPGGRWRSSLSLANWFRLIVSYRPMRDLVSDRVDGVASGLHMHKPLYTYTTYTHV